MIKRSVLLLALVLSLNSWSRVVIDTKGPRYLSEGLSFKLDWADVSDASAKRLFSKDTKRFKKTQNILSMRPDKKVDLKNDMSPVKNQGQRGTCSHFAAMGLVEHFINKHADYSEQCLTFFAGKKDSNNLVDLISHIRKNGVYTEEQCPYKIPEENENWIFANSDERKKLVLEARDIIPDLQHVSRKYLSFDQELQDAEELSDGKYIQYILNKLDAKIPVAISVYVVGKEWKTGVITAIPTEAEIKETCKGGLNANSTVKKCTAHAVVLTGYDAKQGLIYFKNSWDTTWGLNEALAEETDPEKQTGYGVFSYAYLAKFRFGKLITLSN